MTANEKSWHIDRVVCAVDTGVVVNPLGVEQQVESGVIWAITQLMTEITLRNGRVEQSSYADYAVPRIADTPRIEVHILGRRSAARSEWESRRCRRSSPRC